MIEIKLTNAIVKVKDSMTWGDSERVQKAMISSSNVSGKANKEVGFDFNPEGLFEAKYVLLECMIKSITEGEKEIEFTREWMDNLSMEDGNKLYDEVDALSKKSQSSTVQA